MYLWISQKLLLFVIETSSSRLEPRTFIFGIVVFVPVTLDSQHPARCMGIEVREEGRVRSSVSTYPTWRETSWVARSPVDIDEVRRWPQRVMWIMLNSCFASCSEEGAVVIVRQQWLNNRFPFNTAKNKGHSCVQFLPTWFSSSPHNYLFPGLPSESFMWYFQKFFM
jgi:hypothetical protein